MVTAAMQQLEPWHLCSLLMLEVWHDSHPGDIATQQMPTISCRPPASQFLGQATLQLHLPPDRQVSRHVRLKLSNDDAPVKRCITGSVSVQYEWCPNQDQARQPRSQNFELQGQLNVIISHAENIVNLNFVKRSGASNPFCTLLAYPESPKAGQLQPCIWRTSTVQGTCSPRWEEKKRLGVAWSTLKENTSSTLSTSRLCQIIHRSEPPSFNVDSQNAPGGGNTTPDKVKHATRIIRELSGNLAEVRCQVLQLHGRVKCLSAFSASCRIKAASESPNDDTTAPTSPIPVN